MSWKSGYYRFIEDNLSLINKQAQLVPFQLNPVQEKYAKVDSTGKDIILKARQQGFSSLILGKFTTDFILKENSTSMVIADVSDNAAALLERVKLYIKSYEMKHNIKVPLKYNSKSELHNEFFNSKYIIGTAENVDIGRSRTINNLHLSECFFYPHFRKLLAGVLQAVVPDGYVVAESTANGFNEGKEFWDESVRGETGFAPLFYKASDFYSPEFLDQKRKELGRFFQQEYPETPMEAFLTSGDCYFDTLALQDYMRALETTQAVDNSPGYVDNTRKVYNAHTLPTAR